jgi:hypothetical protein
LWSVRIEEGSRKDEGGRYWRPTVEVPGAARDRQRASSATRKAADRERVEGEHVERVLDTLKATPEGDTARQLLINAGLNRENGAKALASLRRDGRIEAFEITKRGQKCDGWRLIKR